MNIENTGVHCYVFDIFFANYFFRLHLMFKKTIFFVFIALLALNSYAENIEIEGKSFNVSIANPLTLKVMSSNIAWVLQSKFAKLTFSEYETPQKVIFNDLLEDIEAAPNIIIQDKFNTVIADSSLIIDHSLIADTVFVRFQKIIGNSQNSAVISFTIPLDHAEKLESEINEMFSNISWKAAEVIVLKQSPKIQLPLPDGYKLTKKYLNSIVLVTTPENITLPQGNVVISLLPKVNPSETLEGITTRTLNDVKNLDKMKIVQLSEASSARGPILNARVVARYEQTQIEVDISHTAINVGQEVLFIQVSAPRNTESFLKLEYVSTQFLESLEYHSEGN